MDGRRSQPVSRPGGSPDVLALLEDFERFVADAPRVPLTGKVVIDEDDLYAFLDQLRRSLPEELQRSRELLRERQRVIEEAQARAQTILEEARREAERLVGESAVLRQAEAEAEKLLARVRQLARQLRAEADSYADDVLGRVEGFLQRALDHVRDGRAQLRPLPPGGDARVGGEAAAAGEAGQAEARRKD